MKRAIDIGTAVLGLILLAPLFGIIAALIKLESSGPALFTQERIGRDFAPFLIYKFRTMAAESSAGGSPITVGDDPRITRIGWFLRRAKLDELPQLINVLKGEMSVVGPRPEVRRYVEMCRDDYVEILHVRPGITDLASLTYVDEAAILSSFADPHAAYVSSILPAKLSLAKDYVRRSSLALDCRVIIKTFSRVIFRPRTPRYAENVSGSRE